MGAWKRLQPDQLETGKRDREQEDRREWLAYLRNLRGMMREAGDDSGYLDFGGRNAGQ